VFGAPHSDTPKIPAPRRYPAPPKQLRRLEDRSSSGDSVISPQSAFKGNISSRSGIRVAGEMKGDIHCEGLVRIEETGKMKGNVSPPMSSSRASSKATSARPSTSNSGPGPGCEETSRQNSWPSRTDPSSMVPSTCPLPKPGASSLLRSGRPSPFGSNWGRSQSTTLHSIRVL